MYAKPHCPSLVKVFLVVVIAIELALVGFLAFGQPSEGKEGAAAGGGSNEPAATQPTADPQPAAPAEGEGAGEGEGGEPAPEPVTLTISFAGDCTLGASPKSDPDYSFNGVYEQEGEDASYFLKNVADLFGADDLTVVNLEGTLTESKESADKDYPFKGSPAYAKVLSGSGVDAATLANDHSLDYREQGYNDTIETLDAEGVSTFGFGRIAYRDVKGVKVALVGACALPDNPAEDYTKEMTDNIAQAKAEGAQLVVVYANWGIEKDYVPQESDMRLGRAAIDAGADVVVGSHPHVVQGWEVYKGRYIVYSLGNFCYGGNSNPKDKDCLIFQETFTVTGTEVAPATENDVKFIACSVSSSSKRNNYQPTLAEGEDAERILAKVQESTDKIAAMAANLGSE